MAVQAGTVLLVDDEEAKRYVLRRTLERAGYRAIEVATAEDALRRAETGEVDLAIVDVRLPDMSGYELCRALKARATAFFPVLLFSDKVASTEARSGIAQADANAFFTPSIDAEELLSIIDAWMHSLAEFRRGARAKERIDRLQAFTAGISAAVSPEEVAQAIARGSQQAVGAGSCLVCTVSDDGSRLERLAQAGFPEELLAAHLPVSIDAELAIAQSAKRRETIFLRSPEDAEKRLGPAAAARLAAAGCEATLCMPLVLHGTLLGAMAFGFSGARPADQDEEAFLEAVARQCALAVERSRLFQAEQRARQEAERTTERTRRILSVVSHDLRSPLTATLTSVQVALRNPELSERTRRSLGRAADSVARMTQLIGDLTDYSQATDGAGLTLHRGPADLDVICQAVIEEVESTAPGRIAYRPDGDGRGNWDAPRLEQVVSNLLTNALEYARPGSPVKLSWGGAGGQRWIEVHNEGEPIAPEQRARIFEAFARAREGRERPGHLGLGLFIVRQVVEAHGGRLELDSGPQGTAFKVWLPA